MKVFSFLTFLYISASAFLIVIILQLGYPAENVIIGPNIFYVPLIIGVLQIFFAVVSMLFSRKTNVPPSGKSSILRWILLLLGVFMLFCGYTVFSISIYTPYLFGYDKPLPDIGVSSFIVVSILLGFILYFASKMNSIKYPNFFRYLVLIIVFFAVSLTTILSLILVYAVPTQPPSTFSFHSALLTLAYLPYSLLVLIITRDYVKIGIDS